MTDTAGAPAKGGPYSHDLLVVWAWEFDADYVGLLKRACEARGLSILLAGAEALKGLPALLDSGALRPRAIIDRVWDWGDEYALHVPAVERAAPLNPNPYPLVKRAWNKPTMHYELIAHGLRAPHMVILPSYQADPDLKLFDPRLLAGLDPTYSVKGAHSGGSGVLKAVTQISDALHLRKDWPDDETLLQSWVEPQLMDGRRAWWRVFHACGRAFACWADDRTHRQTPVTPEEMTRLGLDPLLSITEQIAGICGLNVFSTEIARDTRGVWLVVDYVNEPCDFRLQSKVVNGVPDAIVAQIADTVATWLARRTSRSRAETAPPPPR